MCPAPCTPFQGSTAEPEGWSSVMWAYRSGSDWERESTQSFEQGKIRGKNSLQQPGIRVMRTWNSKEYRKEQAPPAGLRSRAQLWPTGWQRTHCGPGPVELA